MTNFSRLFQELETKTPALFPSQPADAALSQEILDADLFAGKRGEMVENCRAGLLLWNDDLDGAHPIVQNIETSTGSFWHAIIHRREADFSNARYWWNRTGAHPVFEEIGDLVLHRVPDFPLLDAVRGGWNPVAFTNFCQKAKEDGAFLAPLAETQRIEMKLLLEWCASQIK
ncbi:MAG: hypothetical protein KY445_02545 [Armatimonadetes bacterium]|nr:hypothetical protein [Armatimonadota bacterium]